MGSLLHELFETGVVVGACAQWPMKLAIGFVDGVVVDAGFTPSHQAVVVELPVLIAVGTEPLSRRVVEFVLEPNRDPVVSECPQLFGEPVFLFGVPFPGEKSNDLITPLDERVAVAPPAVDAVRQRDAVRISGVPGVLGRPHFRDGGLARERRPDVGRFRHLGSQLLSV